ncbi:hypothetical protein PVAG01_00222 [Phlyctema vagabunda]|uniref:RlpA-like protein double-psi beta-barrel domain-containing protein n=1 Tax=Phlyctema vagabunda TaxID=108571 RepID=A0ABR4PU34_9HELO
MRKYRDLNSTGFSSKVMSTTTHQLPDWEGEVAPKKGFFAKPKLFATTPAHPDKAEAAAAITAGTQSRTQSSLSDRFNRMLPPNRTYFGRSRKIFLLALFGLLLLVVLILGLGLGLGLRNSSSSQNLPLPSNTDTFNGDITYYAPGLGACGITSSSSDAICAVSHIIFDAASSGSNPNANPLCNRKIRLTRFNEKTNKQASIDVTVVDRCTGCKAEDIDLSLSMFEKLASEELGRTTASWAWLN